MLTIVSVAAALAGAKIGHSFHLAGFQDGLDPSEVPERGVLVGAPLRDRTGTAARHAPIHPAVSPKLTSGL